MTMPWWGILALAVLALLSLFMFMAIGMAISDTAAWVFLASELAFVALVWAGLRWAVPSGRKEE